MKKLFLVIVGVSMSLSMAFASGSPPIVPSDISEHSQSLLSLDTGQHLTEHNHAVIATFDIEDPITHHIISRTTLFQDGCKQTVTFPPPTFSYQWLRIKQFCPLLA